LTYAWNFGDGGVGTGANPTHAYDTAGTYTVTVTATDTLGNSISDIVTVTVAAPLVGWGTDITGDGYSDSFLAATGFVPSGPITAAGIQHLTITSAVIYLNFTQTGSDAISVTGTLPIPAGFTVNGQKVYLDIGGFMQGFTLGANGDSTQGNSDFLLNIISDEGGVAAQVAPFIFTVNNASLTSAVAAFGLIKGAVFSAARTIPMTILFDGTVFEAGVSGMYTASTLTGLWGISDNVSALICDSAGNLYAGGEFVAMGGVTAANDVAQWNGSTSSWSALGSGLNDPVSALAFDSAGNLYAGGDFSATGDGSVTANYIAKWNVSTSSWSALGSGLNSDVYALAFDSAGNLYAGGDFSATGDGSVTANYIAMWNNATGWSALGSGMDSDVYALTFDSAGNLYAGGDFTNAGDVVANNIAKWNGSWSALGSGIGSDVCALVCDSAGNLYAGGDFNSVGNVTVDYMIKWNVSTSSWSTLGSEVNGPVTALAADSAGNLYAGGTFYIEGGIPSSSIVLCQTGSAQHVAKPAFNPVAGIYTSTQTVTISTATTNATIYYTTDGSTPSASSTPYLGAVNVSQTTTINAIGIASGMTNSAMASATYTIMTLPLITSPFTASATEGTPFSYQITASGSVPITFTTGNLPTGLNLVGNTISGTPTVCGETVISITATNTAGSDTENLILIIAPASGTPPAPTVTSPPQATVAGQSVTLTAAASDPGVDLLNYTWNFGDSTPNGTGSTATHTYANPGVYGATVTISNGVNSTTESFEVAVGATPFTVSKGSVKFVFNKSEADSMSFTGTLPVVAGFVPNQMSLNVYIGGYTSNLTLNAKGKGSNKTDSIMLSGKQSKSGGYMSPPVKFTYSVKKQTLLVDLEALGFSNSNESSQSISVPIIMVLDGTGYQANPTVSYKATQGKGGSAK
jgi:PKD repeat protein